MTTEFITLNVWNTENIRVKINQGEVNSRFLTIQIIDKNQPLNLEGKEVFFYAKKPDGNLIFNRCEILDAKDGTVNLAVTSQMSTVSGIMQDCELDVLDENLSKLKVKGLIVEIEKCTDFDSATESTSEFSVLDTSLKLVQELIDAYSDENVMAKIMSMDGAGSGLDADLLDGKQGSEYATLEQFQNAVPITRKINSKALTSDVTLTASDVGAAATSHNHSAADVASGTLPIERGGTGETSVKGVQSALKIFTDVSQLKVDYPCTTGDIVYAMPTGSIGFFNVEASSATITDVPTGFSFLEIYKSTQNRVRVLLNGSPSDGTSAATTFNIGQYNASTRTIDRWNRIQTSAFATPINCGGTGATTASAAITNLGAVPTSRTINSKALNSDIELNCEDIGAAPWTQTISDVDVDTIKTDGIYELRYTTFENMHVPSEIQSVAIFPAKFLLIVADINATYYQTILSEWGCYIRRWNQGANISSWKQFGGAASAPLPLTSGGTGATDAYTAQSNMGLMKRYTSLGHLGLSANYTIREIFSAMANNTLIELDISTINVALFPKTQGIARFFKISNNRSYAEFKCTINNGIAGSWVGYYHSDTGFSGWKKIYTDNDTVPIENGGTGATTLTDAQKNLQIYTSVTQLGVTYPCTMSDILEALPEKSIANFGFNVKSEGITDAPISYGEVSIFYPSAARRLIFCNQCISSGGEFSNFYIGYYISSENTIKWFKIPNGNMVTSIANGGTGATTANAALTALGGASTADVGDVSNLETSAKTIVGAVNEVHNALENLAVETGNVEASDIYTMQSSLGLMKRYTNFNHLTLNDGYTLKDVFMAMENNTCIEYPITSSMNITVCPINSGMLKIVRITQYFGYAEFWSNLISENSMWVGSLHSDRGFTWNKIYTSNKTVPIENGGTGATTYKNAQKNLHFYTSLDQLNLTAPCTTADVLNALPVSSIFLLGTESVSASISDAPTGYGFFAIFKGANPNRKMGLFARALSNSLGYETGNWFYILNVENGICTWQKILTNVSTDDTLRTTDKTVIGAINELYNTTELIPIEKGGTGATTADKALKNLKLYTSVGDLGLSYPCTTVDIIQAMPTNSEVKISINSRSGSITDLPLDYCLLTVRYSGLNRYQIFCTNMVSTGSEGTYIGNYVRNTSISWEKIITDGQVLSVANGGTGAATSSEALSNLGAVPTSRKVNSKALTNDITLSASDVGALSASSIKYGLIYLPVGKKFPSQTWTTCVISTTDFIADKTVLGLWPSLIYGNTMEDGSGSKSMSLMPVICGWYDNMKQLNLRVYNFSSNDLYIVENNEHAFKASYVPK